MKFKAMKSVVGLTAGKIYPGSVVVMADDTVRIVVFNDRDRWRSYRSILFEPA